MEIGHNLKIYQALNIDKAFWVRDLEQSAGQMDRSLIIDIGIYGQQSR